MKAIEDFIDGETFRAIKGLSLPELNRYLYSIYAAGYAAGLNDGGGDRLLEALKNATERVIDQLQNQEGKGAP